MGVLYSGVLALIFSVTGRQLPPRGLLTPLFLGLAIVLSSAYVGYLSNTRRGSTYPSANLDGWLADSQRRITSFIAYVRELVHTNVWSLRASILALGASLIFIAAPFVSFVSLAPASSVQDSGTALTPWPAPTAGPTPNALDQIAYKAQVAEVAQLRQAQLADASAPTTPGFGKEDAAWYGVAVLVGVAGWRWARRPVDADPGHAVAAPRRHDPRGEPIG